MDMLIQLKRPVMLIGNAGLGKTVIINDKLAQLGDDYTVSNVPFNFYTTSEMLQRVLEKPLEKKAGRNYGPPGNKKLIYFIDDMNMPEVGTRRHRPDLHERFVATLASKYTPLDQTVFEHFAVLLSVLLVVSQ